MLPVIGFGFCQYSVIAVERLRREPDRCWCQKDQEEASKPKTPINVRLGLLVKLPLPQSLHFKFSSKTWLNGKALKIALPVADSARGLIPHTESLVADSARAARPGKTVQSQTSSFCHYKIDNTTGISYFL